MSGWDFMNIIWLIMAVVFFYFAILFWIYSRSGLRPFLYGTTADSQEDADDNLSDAIPEDLRKEMESFRRSINTTMQTRFRIGAISMALAGGCAIISMLLC
jgi:hypothetical protein